MLAVKAVYSSEGTPQAPTLCRSDRLSAASPPTCRKSPAMLAATRAAEGLDRIPRQMRIARRGLDLAVAEQLRDHGQALAQR